MMELFSANIKRKGLTTEVAGLKELSPKDIEVPGDISSAAFFLVASSILPGSRVILRNVGINPTRKGIIDVLTRMGGDIRVLCAREGSEPSADIEVHYAPLKSTVVEAQEVPLLIDEIPALSLAAAMSEGRTVFKGVKELKVKETDRVKSIIDNFRKLGVEAEESGDSLVINGGEKTLRSAEIDSLGDHRIAMIGAIAALVSDDGCFIRDTACVDTSYPGFLADLEKMSG
jgi:3-phosphoshikimate 1-carboxyvinyltransferase